MKPIAIDTETALITEAEPTPQGVCGSLAYDDPAFEASWGHKKGGEAGGVLLISDFVPLVRDLAEDPGIEFCGLNIAYDWRVLIRHGLPIETVFKLYNDGRVLDVGLAWHLHDIASGIKRYRYSLAAASDTWLGELLAKENTFRLRYGELIGVPLEAWPEEARVYPWTDAVTTLRVRHAVPEEPDARRQSAYDLWLSLSGAHGFRTDPERVEKVRQRCITEAADLILKLPDGWVSIDRDGELHKHTKKIRAYAEKYPELPYTPGSLKPKLNKKTGEKEIRKEKSLAFEDLQDTKDPALMAYAKLGQRLSILDNDMNFLTRPRVRTNYNLADTGRTTSSGSDDIPGYTNLQNVKTDAGVRECFIADDYEGIRGVLLNADYNGLELCTIAQACMSLFGRSKMAEMLRSGADPHCAVAAEILSRSYEETVKTWEAEGKKNSDVYNARQCGKIANFGMAGGAGAAAVEDYARSTYGVRMMKHNGQRSCACAECLKEKWFKAFPEMRDYLTLGGCSGPNMTSLFTGRRYGGLRYTQINNYKFQGLGGDITKAAGFQIAFECYADPSSPLYGCRIVAFVHDEFVLSCPRHRMLAAAERLRELMTTGAPAKLCPDVPLKTTPIICERWSKSAEVVKVDGVIIPWDDCYTKHKETKKWIDTRTGEELKAAA
jgi:DNA polymerase-1